MAFDKEIALAVQLACMGLANVLISVTVFSWRYLYREIASLKSLSNKIKIHSQGRIKYSTLLRESLLWRSLILDSKSLKIFRKF